MKPSSLHPVAVTVCRRLLPAAVLPMLLLLGACHLEIEGSKNGSLDGNWHLIAADTLAEDSAGHSVVVASTDLENERFFWSVQGNIIMLYSPDYQGGQRYVSQFSYADNTLSFYSLRYHDRPRGDAQVDNIAELFPFGICQQKSVFRVQELKGSRLVLSTDKLRLTFRKQ